MYTKEQVQEATKDYFKGDELAANVFFKYALKDKLDNYHEKTPDDMHRRLAKEFARAESAYKNAMSEDEIFELFQNFKWVVPQGSPMYGIGNNFALSSLSNCVVVSNPEDTVSSIMDSGKDLANLFKRRCGVGIDITDLRPENMPVNNSAGTTTGAWSFSDFYSYVCRMIGQNGRRGALMISIDIRHPDVEKFAVMKQDLTKVTGANVSIRITDDFMHAVENDLDFTLHFPVGSPNPKFTKTVKAKELWNLVVDSATKTAEPGLLMWDNIIKNLPAHCYPEFKTLTTNPCFPSSEWLLTENGYEKFGDLYVSGKNNDVVCDNRISYVSHGDITEKPEYWNIDVLKTGTSIRKASNVFLTKHNSEILEIETSRGFKIKCTPDHHIATTIGMVEAQYLTLDHQILISTPENNGSILNRDPSTKDEILAALAGLIAGDGTYDKDRKRVHIDLWGADKERMKNKVINQIDKLFTVFGSIKNSKNRELSKYMITYITEEDKIRISSSWLAKILEKEINFTRESKHSVPLYIMNNASTNVGKFYLAGLMYADGTAGGNKKSGFSVRLNQSNKDFLNAVQMVFHANGILMGLYKRRDEREVTIRDKKYNCVANYELISVNGGFSEYAKKIGFLGDSIKEAKLIVDHTFKKHNGFTDVLVSKQCCQKENVFCLKEDIGRNIIVNGVSVRRCGEIPLSAYDSCRLISINLKHFVKHPFSKDSYFDLAHFETVVEKATRLSDDLIELEIEKLIAIIDQCDTQNEKELWTKLLKACENGRRTGLGTHGLADAIACCGFRYDSEEGITLIDQIYETFRNTAYKTSVKLAKERGPFPLYDWKLEKDNEFINRLPEHIQKEMKKYGRRNISLLTNAPTGSVSIESQTSSGIEPVFKNFYIRRRKLDHSEMNTKSDFVDQLGDRWLNFKVYHHNVLEYLDRMKTDVIPDFFVESDNINWQNRVRIQATIQKYIDHSISSTINLPKGTTPDIVGQLYLNGWKMGLKGITVYVDGSRDGVLITTEATKELEFKQYNAPKRKSSLDCNIHHLKIKGEKWIVLVGLFDGKPYEVFGGLADKIIIPSGIKTGKITKKKTDHYELEFGEDGSIGNIKESFSNTQYADLTRLISLSLRHGTDVKFIVEQILKSETESMTTFSKALARVLKEYIKQGEEVTGSASTCPSCKGKLIYQDGCATCKEGCGWSKCY